MKTYNFRNILDILSIHLGRKLPICKEKVILYSKHAIISIIKLILIHIISKMRMRISLWRLLGKIVEYNYLQLRIFNLSLKIISLLRPLIILLNGDLGKDFKKISMLLMDFGQFGIEIGLGKSIMVQEVKVAKPMGISLFI